MTAGGTTKRSMRSGWGGPRAWDGPVRLPRRAGHDRDAILGTGLFYPRTTLTRHPEPHFRGRYVLPYFDADGRPVYAISRTAGLEADPKSRQKYTKAQVTSDYAQLEEPIYGTQTIEAGKPILITEGVADAITAHEAGYPCISPVTKEFKTKHHEPLLGLIEEHDVPRVWIVNDAELPGSDITENGELTISQLGEGEAGAIKTAAFLADNGLTPESSNSPAGSRG